jgi:NOL1/NOP2/fmu family ribosome biogenesis protein
LALSTDGFDRSIQLPPALGITHIKNAIEFIEQRAEEWLDIYLEQANIFSGVIGILGVRALDSLSAYKAP